MRPMTTVNGIALGMMLACSNLIGEESVKTEPKFSLPPPITVSPLRLDSVNLESSTDLPSGLTLDEKFERLNTRYKLFNGTDILTRSSVLESGSGRLDRIFSMEVTKIVKFYVTG